MKFKKSLKIISLIVALGCILFTSRYYKEAFAIKDVPNLTEKDTIIKSADQLLKKYNWVPANSKEYVHFKKDTSIQGFIELEVGGKKTYDEMLSQKLYEPNLWSVRFYLEGNKNEAYIYFTPDGQPYGFHVNKDYGNDYINVDVDTAKKLVELECAENWGINFDNYKLYDTSEKIENNGCKHYELIYQRIDATLDGSYYGMKITIDGNKVTELNHFVNIPKNFTEKYKKMRIPNNIMTGLSKIIVYGIYFIGCCILGMFLLRHKHRIDLKKLILIWGGIVIIQCISRIISIDDIWVSYNTSITMKSYLINQIIHMIIPIIFNGFVLAVSIIASETFTLEAFPDKIRIFNLRKAYAEAPDMLINQISFGYMLAIVKTFFIIFFYLIAANVFGWWVPSNTVINPSLPLQIISWVPPIFNSISTAIMEECLFRAVPIAIAVIISRKSPHKRKIVGFVIFVQAIIFGMAHTNFAGQPSYFRLLELLLPGIIYGIVYIKVGIIPILITHTIYDIFILSMPVFNTNLKGLFISKLLIIAFSLAPLIIISILKLKRNLSQSNIKVIT